MHQSVYSNAGNASKIFDNMVNVICHFNTTHGSHPAKRDGQSIQECDLYPGVTCQEHAGNTGPIGKKLNVGGNIGTPMTIIVDPNTFQEYMRKNGAASAGEIEAAMKKAQADMGPSLNAKDAALLEKFSAEYTDLSDPKLLKKALKDAKGLVKLQKKFQKGPAAALTSVENTIADFVKVGLDLVDAAANSEDEKALKQIQKDWKDFDEVKDAAKEALEALK
jgi:hypothetical protein